VLPAITLATFMMPQIARLTRSGLLDVLSSDYIRTARSQGIDERTITYKYALRNVAISLITVLGLQIGTLIGGAVITETVFAWPGVGSFTVEALYRRDYPVVMAAVTIVAVAFVIINLIVDIFYVLIDPRVRLGSGGMK
jgi:peptide/nickel transport system permease protein